MDTRDLITPELAAGAVRALARLFDPPPESEAQPEPPPPAETVAVEILDHPDHGLSESDLETVRTIYQTTIEQGHALHKCDSSEQAQRWAAHLNQHLPDDRECFVIRGREVNCYTHN